MGSHLPSNVLWFERLSYFSLAIGLVEFALHWIRHPVPASAIDIAAFLFVGVGLTVAILVTLIWLTARCRKNWARWTLLVLEILGLPFSFTVLGRELRSSPVWGSMNIVGNVSDLIAMVLIFTGNGRVWFSRPAGVQ
jgi:hypothetical protein